MSISSLCSNDVILTKLGEILQIQAGNIADVVGDAPIDVAVVDGVATISLPIAGTYSASNNVVKGSSATALVWGSDASGSVLSFDAPLDLTGTIVSLPIAGTWSAQNNVVKGSSATALEWGTDASGSVLSFDAPLDLTGTIVSLPIAGTWSAQNNVVKGSSATALEWGTDASGVVLSFDAPLDLTGTIVSLPIAGTWSASNSVVKGSSATALEWGTDVSGGQVDSVGAGEFVVVSGTATDPIVALDVALPAVSGYVLSSTTAGVLSWIPDGTGGAVESVAAGDYLAVSGTAINPVVALNVGLPAVNGHILSSTTAGTLSWVADAGGQVDSVAAGDFVAVSGTATDPIVALDVALPAVSGYVLSSTTAGVLSWIPDGTGGAVESVAAGDFLAVSGTAINPVVALDVGLPAVSGYVLSSTTAGALSWIPDDAGGQVNNITAGDFIAVNSAIPTAPVVSLDVGLPAASGYLLSSTAGGALSWTPPFGTIEIDAANTDAQTPVVGVETALLNGVFNQPLQVGDWVSIGSSVDFVQTAGAAPSLITTSGFLTFAGNPVVNSSYFVSSAVDTTHPQGVSGSMYFKILTAGTYGYFCVYGNTLGVGATLETGNTSAWMRVERGLGV